MQWNSRRAAIAFLSAALAAGAGFGVVYVAAIGVQVGGKTQPAPPAAAPAQKPQAGFARLVRHAKPQAAPEIVFKDGEGKTRSLAEWRGKIVILNLWATWCAPCIVEMPSLERLQKRLGDAKAEIVALSLDRSGQQAPKQFLEANGLTGLGLYVDESGEAGFKIKAAGLPTTIIFDREGREIARLPGAAEWDADEAVDYLRSLAEAR